MEETNLNKEIVSRVASDLNLLIDEYIEKNYDPYRIRGMVDSDFKNDVLHNVLNEVKREMTL